MPRTLSFVLTSVVCLVGSVSSSPSAANDYLNADPAVAYIGSDACLDCHPKQFESYANSLHSRSAAPVDVKKEPADGTFKHPSLPVRYSAIQRDGQMFHREEVLDEDGKPAITTEHAVDVAFGSGLHAKTYLFREGDFHAQSPISYFREKGGWSLSPGFDRKELLSFRRDTTDKCVFCHVGSIQQESSNPHIFDIVEHRIGCERCHGPGQLHAQQQQDNNVVDAGTGDLTIVNPARLARELSEAVCAQCHCQGDQSVIASGKELWDFRPGQLLTDVRVDFNQQSDGPMQLVGHTEQMHRSECYIQSETLTCVSCHNPHQATPVDQPKRVEFYRDACFKCHQNESCGEPIAQRRATNKNDCADCHMPRQDTTVTHVALHNHQIAVYPDQPTNARAADSPPVSSDPKESPWKSLSPVLSVKQHSAGEQQRLAGLARYHAIRFPNGREIPATFAQQTIADLLKVRASGFGDDSVNSALAWLAFRDRQNGIAIQLSGEVVSNAKDQSDATIVATEILAEALFKSQRNDQAMPLFQKMRGYQRDSHNLYLLGLVQQNLGNSPAAIESLAESIRINPMQSGGHFALQAIYQSLGKEREAAFHAGRGSFIDQWNHDHGSSARSK